jgi:hypothetical protein
MNPRRVLNFFRSPTGALLLFLLGLVILLIPVNSRRSSHGPVVLHKGPSKSAEKGTQLPQTVNREMVPFNTQKAMAKEPASEQPRAGKAATPPPLPLLSLVAETPVAPTKEDKKISEYFAPYGRLIPCELVITVDSSSIQTPIVGLVTEDVFHHGQLIIPAGTEVHGSAQVDRARERIASKGRWTLVWQDGKELNVSGLALDHEIDPDTGIWGITDGSAGLRGKLLKTDNLAEVKLYIATLLSGAASALTENQVTAFGTFALPTLQNAPLQGAQAVLDRYAQQILQAIERDGFYVRVPAGKQFYLYVTQTLDEEDARIGGTRTASLPPAATPTPTPALRSAFPSPVPIAPGLEPISSTSATNLLQPNRIP